MSHAWIEDHPSEKNSELVDADEFVAAAAAPAPWNGDLCLKQSSEILGGETATVTDDE